MRIRRRPFDELVDRQLALFAADESTMLAEADEAEAAWVRSGREHAEEAYGDYQLVVDALADRLLDLREAYAATLAEDKAEAYRRTFAGAVKRRFSRYASLVSDVESS
jgi:sirohydrochlorin ferrochelatase